jgi:hypothetical protein
VDGPLLVERLGPRLLVRNVGIQSSKGFCDPMDSSRCNTGIRQVKPFTCRTLCVSKKLLYTIFDNGHPHEMVFVEPSHAFLDEMVSNQDDCLAFELQSLPGVGKIAIGVGTLLVVSRLDMYRTKVLLYRTMVLMVRLTKVRR